MRYIHFAFMQVVIHAARELVAWSVAATAAVKGFDRRLMTDPEMS